MTVQAVGLLCVLFAAHFLGDFTPLASSRMQEAKARGSPVAPIAAHAAIHAVLVGLAVAVVARPGMGLLILAVALEFTTHLALDWLRGHLGARRPGLSDPGHQSFWTAMGLDQLGHALVLVGIAAMVLRGS